MVKKLFPSLFVSLLALLTIFGGLTTCAMAQQKKIPQEPFQIVDAVTGKSIPQVLVIPVYNRFQGISTMLGEGPGSGTYTNYLDKPFVYRTGAPFTLKLPKSSGLNAGILFIGKGRSLNGILIVASRYSPQMISDLWSTREERKLRLKSISDNQWSALLEEKLIPLTKNSSPISNNCQLWSLPEKCSLEIKYDEKERELVRSFLQQTTMKMK